ncbi:MAG TPA: nucleotidyltransferase family protein [Edaphobacter sp.]|nr:nucleotidyltransferase family protein [Edaphobacter sp.]
MNVAAVVLAAGASRRLGSPKQLQALNGEVLLQRAVRVTTEAGCSPVIVVLGADAEKIRAACPLSNAVVVVNGGWEEGMASSLRLGVETCRALAREAEGIVVMTCDQPAVTAAHLRQLMSTDSIVASRYSGRNGVPAFFPVREFDALMKLQGDAGARELIASADAVDLEGGEVDIDTAADLEQAQRWVASKDDADSQG